MSDYAYGVYIIQQWANLGGANPQTALANFKAAYGDDAISAIGNSFNTEQLNVSAIKDQFKKLQDGGAKADSPTEANINAAMLAVGAQGPSFGSVVSSAVSETVDEVESGAATVASYTLSGLKWIAIGAVAILGIYAAWELGWIKHAAGKLRAS